jgi:hypothetical protein
MGINSHSIFATGLQFLFHPMQEFALCHAEIANTSVKLTNYAKHILS